MSENKEFIKNRLNSNIFDYKKILSDSVHILYEDSGNLDINVIVPVRGRANFSEPLFKTFFDAAKNCELKVSYTIVEHSENPEQSKFCKKNKINYIWIKSNPGELFNKCLAQNMGAFFGPKTKYLLFHDIDCLVQSDFFQKLIQNIDNQKAKAIQNFTGRRVLYISPELTNEVISGNVSVDDLSLELDDINLPGVIGAPGGSITIERDLFFEAGGYDPELFLANSPEDIFFWHKVDLLDKMKICDNPHIDIYHMYHPPTWMHNPFMQDMENIYKEFESIEYSEKIKIIHMMSNLISEFK